MKKSTLKLLVTTSALVITALPALSMTASASGIVAVPYGRGDIVIPICYEHDYYEHITARSCDYYDADRHTVAEAYEVRCNNQYCNYYDTGYREYLEGHFYDYNYSTGYWECECEDSYRHD